MSRTNILAACACLFTSAFLVYALLIGPFLRLPEHPQFLRVLLLICCVICLTCMFVAAAAIRQTRAEATELVEDAQQTSETGTPSGCIWDTPRVELRA